jgi:hypothetical protein
MFFTYWEGDQFSYFNYLTILSLYKLNPGKDITVYTSEVPQNDGKKTWEGNEHDIKIKKYNFSDILPMVNLVKINFEKTYGISNDMHVVNKGDCIRVIKLYEHGGIWFDMDILFIKPIPDYMLNNQDHQMITHAYHGTIATGIISCQPNSTIMKFMNDALFNKIKLYSNTEIKGYQWVGCDLWRDVVLETRPTELLLARTSDVYPYLYDNLNELYYSTRDVISENTYAIHWYNGSPVSRNFINNFDINENNVFNKYVRAIV